MRQRKSEKEQPRQMNTELTDFYELLDALLPQQNELLRDTLEKTKKDLQNTLAKRQGQNDYLLELEKGKNSCLQELLQIFVDKYQRISADYANFQKRVPKQMADTMAHEKEKMIKTLLPTVDNFESALGGLQKAHTGEDIDTLVKGVQIIYDQMLNILKSHGLEQIEAMGEKFDPALHEAIMQQAEPEQEQDTVLEEFQKGYKLNGRVIRPSKVIVNKLPSSEQPAAQQGQDEQKPHRESIDLQEQPTEKDQATNVE